MNPIKIGVIAETLTPFCYHSLMVHNGTATLPELIGDRAIAFGLAATLGLLQSSVALPKKDYRNHLKAMPYRTSVFTIAHEFNQPRLLPPLVRRLNLDEEGGYPPEHIAKGTGNLRTFFQTQEVPHGQKFKGAIFGFDPFEETGKEELVIRIGLHRNGMLLLKKSDKHSVTEAVNQVCLNAATAALFDCPLPVKRYCLHGLQLTPEYSLQDAWQEVSQWD